MRFTALLTAFLVLGTLGCASRNRGDEAYDQADVSEISASNQNAKPPELGGPSKLKHDEADVPPEVRAIETLIDQEGVILADECEIEVSKNYEYDVSLTGDHVTKDLDKSGATERIAKGNAFAFVRNLQIKCDNSVRMKVAGFGTQPFIRIRAKGHCSHVVADRESGKHAIRRSKSIVIDDNRCQYVGETTPPRMQPVSTTNQ